MQAGKAYVAWYDSCKAVVGCEGSPVKARRGATAATEATAATKAFVASVVTATYKAKLILIGLLRPLELDRLHTSYSSRLIDNALSFPTIYTV